MGVGGLGVGAWGLVVTLVYENLRSGDETSAKGSVTCLAWGSVIGGSVIGCSIIECAVTGCSDRGCSIIG